MSDFVTIGQKQDIPIGEGRAIPVGSRMVAVFNRDGEFTAIDDMCPHMGASLATGFLEGCEVSCPWHAWRFDVRDGTWCDNRRIKIDSFVIRVEGEELKLRVDEAGEPVPTESTSSGSPGEDSPFAPGADL